MTNASRVPTVAITYVVSDGMPADFRKGVFELLDVVVDSLTALGVSTLLVNAAEPAQDTAAVLAAADGVLVMGGVDIDPAVYGEQITSDTVKFIHPSADAYEVDLIQAAHRSDAPVFGICRGSQLINVAFGGSLIQDLGPGMHVATVVGDDAPVDDVWTNHDVNVEPGTRLAAILGQERFDARVGHHQAVDRVGAGLRVSATADDGVVEGLESVDGWVVGVQWHPEEHQADPEQLGKLLEGFVEALRERITERAA